jgi:hypothetical protein
MDIYGQYMTIQDICGLHFWNFYELLNLSPHLSYILGFLDISRLFYTILD